MYRKIFSLFITRIPIPNNVYGYDILLKDSRNNFCDDLQSFYVERPIVGGRKDFFFEILSRTS